MKWGDTIQGAQGARCNCGLCHEVFDAQDEVIIVSGKYVHKKQEVQDDDIVCRTFKGAMGVLTDDQKPKVEIIGDRVRLGLPGGYKEISLKEWHEAAFPDKTPIPDTLREFMEGKDD